MSISQKDGGISTYHAGYALAVQHMIYQAIEHYWCVCPDKEEQPGLYKFAECVRITQGRLRDDEYSSIAKDLDKQHDYFVFLFCSSSDADEWSAIEIEYAWRINQMLDIVGRENVDQKVLAYYEQLQARVREFISVMRAIGRLYVD